MPRRSWQEPAPRTEGGLPRSSRLDRCTYDWHVDELALAKRLIAFDTSNAEGLRRAAEFVGGWLESNDIEASQTEARELPTA